MVAPTLVKINPQLNPDFNCRLTKTSCTVNPWLTLTGHRWPVNCKFTLVNAQSKKTADDLLTLFHQLGEVLTTSERKLLQISLIIMMRISSTTTSVKKRRELPA